MTGGNRLILVLKRMLRHFLKTTQKNIRISRLRKRLWNIYKKKFKPEIKPIIENLQDELYQLENKQSKGT